MALGVNEVLRTLPKEQRDSIIVMGVIDRARRFTLPLPRVLYRVYRGGGRAVRSRA